MSAGCQELRIERGIYAVGRSAVEGRMWRRGVRKKWLETRIKDSRWSVGGSAG
jgi:hypothetical protein